MDIFGFAYQPNPSNVPVMALSAYRQIRYIVAADTLCPPDQPMYADIYFLNPTGGPTIFFYKSLTSYSIDSTGGHSLFLFDVQDACQEYLQTYIPAAPNIGVVQTDSAGPYSDITCVVYFRGSTYSGALLVPNPTVPVQGTATSAPVAGTGTPAFPIIVYNASILPRFQTIYDNNLEAQFATKQVTDGTFLTGTRVYPLSNLPFSTYLLPNTFGASKMYRGYYASTPVVIMEFGLSGILPRYSRSCSVWLEYGSNGVMVNFIQLTAPAVFSNSTYYLPCGIANLQAILGATDYGIFTSVSGNNYYRIGIKDEDAGGKWCYHSPLYKVETTAIESYCLWFQNMDGHFEAVTFVRNSEMFKTTSSEQFVPYTQAVGYGLLNPLAVGHKRYNVRANDEITLTAVFSEAILPWIKELAASPYVLHCIDSGTFDAVTVIDGSFDTKKSVKDGRVNYEVSIKIKPAIDYITLRN